MSPTAFEQARGGALGPGVGGSGRRPGREHVGFAGRRPLLSRPRARPRGAFGSTWAAAVEPAADLPQIRSSRGREGVLVGLDGCEVRLSDPCACVRPFVQASKLVSRNTQASKLACVSMCVSVSRLPPGFFYRLPPVSFLPDMYGVFLPVLISPDVRNLSPSASTERRAARVSRSRICDAPIGTPSV